MLLVSFELATKIHQLTVILNSTLHAYAVAFAKLFFPSEAQLAMLIAEADSTEEFDAIRLKEIDLKTPGMHRRLRERFDALTKTGSPIDIGASFFT